MFAVLQLPFVDVRRFLMGETARLPVPTWPFPVAGKEFIRSSGSIRELMGGGVDVWPGEDVYCDATHALKFPELFPRFVHLGKEGALFTRRSVFRRYLTDGQEVSRIEVGFSYQPVFPEQTRLRPREWFRLVESICNLPVRVPRGGAHEESIPLVNAGNHLALHFLNATTQRHSGSSSGIPEFWLTPGDPLLLLEYDLDCAGGLPKFARSVRALGAKGLKLSALRVGVGTKSMGVWLLGTPGKVTNQDYVRRLRIHLFRLHAQRQAIKQVFRLVVAGKIAPDPFSPASERLQRFLLDSTRLLVRKQRYGLPQSELLEVAQQCDDLVSEGERVSLLASLAHVRPNLLRNLTTFTQPEKFPAPVYQIVGEQVTVISNSSGVAMKKQSLRVNGDVSGVLNQTAADEIADSLNTKQSKSSIEAIDIQLASLREAIAGIEELLSPEQRNELGADLRMLEQQARSASPVKKWYEVSAAGIIEAAKTLGAIGRPVKEAVRNLLQLLA